MILILLDSLIWTTPCIPSSSFWTCFSCKESVTNSNTATIPTTPSTFQTNGCCLCSSLRKGIMLWCCGVVLVPTVRWKKGHTCVALATGSVTHSSDGEKYTKWISLDIDYLYCTKGTKGTYRCIWCMQSQDFTGCAKCQR